jgi:hypothetical protein
MFGMKKREVTPSDQLLKQISDLLFPPFEKTEVEGEKFAVDSSVDTNLDAVLTDLREGYMDDVCINTLQMIAMILFHARDLLKAYHQMDPDVSKYIITMGPVESMADKIEPDEDESL